MRKSALRPDSPTFKMLAETGLFQLLTNEQQNKIIQNMIDDHNQQMARLI